MRESTLVPACSRLTSLVGPAALLGNHGQYVYVAPHADAVIVRVGSDWGADNRAWLATFRNIANPARKASLLALIRHARGQFEIALVEFSREEDKRDRPSRGIAQAAVTARASASWTREFACHS
jgi:hypothetical protein